MYTKYKEVNEMNKEIMKLLPENKKDDQMYWNIQPIKGLCILISASNFFFQIIWLRGDHFGNKYMHAVYWLIWILYTSMIVYSQKYKKPQLFRIILQLVVIRMLLPYFNIEKRNYDDFLKLLLFFFMQLPYMIILEIFVCLFEKVWVSVIYIFVLTFLINWRVIVMTSDWFQTNKPSNDKNS